VDRISLSRTGALLLLTLAVSAAAPILACGGSGASPSATGATAPQTQSTPPPQCDSSLWKNVYDPTRLTVKSACETVTGTIIKQHPSDDGDIDMQLKLDPPYTNLLNAANISKLSGNLNVEAICQAEIKPDTPQAVPACHGLPRLLALPPIGTHVQVTGTYVLDTNHGWMELHPISIIDPR
jgi:hypothetical protein